jgi:5S rRNA maturation endonuclease (ribonuclease M5)
MENINLNSIEYNSQITREDILKHITQEEIFSFYLGEDVNSLGVFHSPLREDNIPSFALYFHKHHRNILMFKDFATNDCGDFIVLVMKLFNVDYPTALKKIALDLKLANFNIDLSKQVVNYTRIVDKEGVKLGIKSRPWLVKDKNYWSSFGIKKSTLSKFNVHPVDYIFYNDTAVKAAEYAYAYVELKDGKVTYKIYQPFESKLKKWINNANYSVHQGYTQLPQQGELLIITKSLKDVMSIHDCLNISAIGLQSESVMMKESVMQEYKNRFKKVICLFDNDSAGKKLSENFTNTYNIPHFFVPELPGVTDFSDLVKALGVEKASNIINTNLKELWIK